MDGTEPQARKGRKYDQVIAGALEIFLRDGFEGASVDDISKAAGVSKATLYSYFPDKRFLFMEVATSQCLRQADDAILTIDQSRDPEYVLTRAGISLLGILFSKLGMQTFRVCVGEAERFPELAHEFYRTGPMRLRGELIKYFVKAMAREELVIPNCEMAADQFGELCKARLWPEFLFGIRTSATEAEIREVVDEAVKTFLARYAAK